MSSSNTSNTSLTWVLAVNNNTYYMASSASGQDDLNRALWLATRAGKMEPSCPLGSTRCVPQAKLPRKPYNKSFIDQVCSVKMAGYWPRSFFASLWTSTSSRSINLQKTNLANIQPSWPHTWSITHTNRVYVLLLWRYAFCKTLFSSRVLEFCLREINWDVVIDWQLPFFFFLMTLSLLCCRPRSTGAAIDDPGNISWLQGKSCQSC